MYEHGVQIARRIGVAENPDSFNPVLVDFYREVGYLPDAIINYLLLLGWSLDDKTEMFSSSEMKQHFSLERVVKNEASFDPSKLTAFQSRYMAELDTKTKTEMCLKYLIGGGVVAEPVSDQHRNITRQIVEAARDRIVVAGDILQFDGFFVNADQLPYDDAAFEKRLVKPDNAGHLLSEYMKILTATSDWSAEALESQLKEWCEQTGIKIGDIIHALRVAVTGQAAGFGMFESLEVLGQSQSIARVNVALDRLSAIR